VRQLVFGDAGPALDKVLVDGRLIVDDGRLLTIDLAALRRQAEGYAAELRDELERITDRVKPLYGDIERAARRAQGTEWRLASCPAHDGAQRFMAGAASKA
jgi:5-methylthioadenosine/S-adenosylhomocysteine deaminase